MFGMLRCEALYRTRNEENEPAKRLKWVPQDSIIMEDRKDYIIIVLINPDRKRIQYILIRLLWRRLESVDKLILGGVPTSLGMSISHVAAHLKYFASLQLNCIR